MSATSRTPRPSACSAPDATVTLDFALKRLAGLIDKLVVYPENMQKNLDRLGGLIHSQRVLTALTQKGCSREESYSLVQRNAMPVWRGEGDFQTLLKKDAEREEISQRRRDLGAIRPRLSPQARRYHLQARVRRSVTRAASMSSVVAVSARSGHHFSKTPVLCIRLLDGPRRRRRRPYGRDGQAPLARAPGPDPAQFAPGAPDPCRVV